MADYYGATIYIGGQLPAKELPFFIQALNNEIPGLDELPDDTPPEKFMEFLGDMIGVDDGISIIGCDGSLKFFVAQARYGEFDEIESFCHSNNLTYIRYSDAYAEYEADVRWWGPGMEKISIQICDTEYKATLRKKSIRDMMIRKESIRDMMKDIEQFKPEDAPLLINETSSLNQEYLANWSLKNTWDKWEALKALMDNLFPEPPASPGKFEII